jgi:medium-chain acyl-[acyl-carrier-protein] hydrolase
MNAPAVLTTRGGWIVRPRKALAGATVRLICVPYAGGAASAFRLWPDLLPNGVDLCAVQLPGREQRHRETLLTEMPVVARAVADAVLPLADLPLVFFGHSMGAIIAYETARLLQQQHGVVARRLIVSGRRPPHVPSQRPDMHALPTPALLDQLRRLNGTPADVLTDQEMLDVVLPIIRADFKLIETYPVTEAVPLACPVSAIGGDIDPDVSPGQLDGWRTATRNVFETHLFAGDHFYLNTQKVPLLRFISQRMAAAIDLC